MQKTIMVIDGYNVIHKVPAWESLLNDDDLEGARRSLMAFCAAWMASRRDIWMFYVVFDGDPRVLPQTGNYARGVRQIFTGSGEKADDRIVDIVRERESDCRIIVVTEDRQVMRQSRAFGAELLNVSAFYSTTASSRQRKRHSGEVEEDKNCLTPNQKKMINDELRRIWA